LGRPQTILITDAGGRVITWKEVGGEPSFRSCELEIVNGAVYLGVTCDERHSMNAGEIHLPADPTRNRIAEVTPCNVAASARRAASARDKQLSSAAAADALSIAPQRSDWTNGDASVFFSHALATHSLWLLEAPGKPVESSPWKRLTLLIASSALVVLLGVAFASKDLILTTWYAHRLQSNDDDERRAAIASLGQLGTRRAARVLVAFLGDWGAGALSIDTAVALKDMGKVAMEPVVEGFRLADDIAAEPGQKWPDNLMSLHPMYVDATSMLIVSLEIQRQEPRVESLLENLHWRLPPAEDLDLDEVKCLKWLSAVLAIEGKPCRIFLLAYYGGDSPALQPQTIVITDAGGTADHLEGSRPGAPLPSLASSKPSAARCS
jgi:hypothetical protein